MKQSTSALRAILAQPQFYMADCYSFTLVDGTVLRYTTADLDLTGGGNVFLPPARAFPGPASSSRPGFRWMSWISPSPPDRAI